MSTLSLAYNRFGLGARGDDAPPEDARGWLLAQFDRYEPRPEAIAGVPTRVQVAGELAAYIEETRMARAEARRSGVQPNAPGNAQGQLRPRPALRAQQAAAARTEPAMDMQAAAPMQGQAQMQAQ